MIYPLGADFRRTNNRHSQISVFTGGIFQEPGQVRIVADLPHNLTLWQADACHRALGLAVEATRNMEQRWRTKDPAEAQALLPAMERLVAEAAAIHAAPPAAVPNVQPLPIPRVGAKRSASR